MLQDGLPGHLRLAGVEDQVALVAWMLGLRAIDAQARVQAVALEPGWRNVDEVVGIQQAGRAHAAVQ